MSDEQRGAGAQTDEERARAIREQLKSLHAFDLAYEMMVSLVSFGYQKLGLTGETLELRDLGDARLAIELLRATLEVVEREQGEEHTRDLRSTLAQMQLGYVQAVEMEGRAPAPPEPAAPAPDAAPPAPTEKPAAAKRPAKKPAAKAGPARKPAAKKSPAKKPAARKPRGGATPPAG